MPRDKSHAVETDVENMRNLNVDRFTRAPYSNRWRKAEQQWERIASMYLYLFVLLLR